MHIEQEASLEMYLLFILLSMSQHLRFLVLELTGMDIMLEESTGMGILLEGLKTIALSSVVAWRNSIND